MMNWDHLQDLSKDDLIARVILGEWQQVNWERAYNEMKQRAEAAERKAEESARDAARYRFIRDDDNWQDDAPDTATWDNLGELSMAEFDAAVDKKMSAAYWEKNPIQAAIAAKGEA